MRIVFVRHGEGYHNLNDSSSKNKHNPNWDILYPGLTSVGKKQAMNLYEKFMNENIDLVLVSPLKRTLETYEGMFKERSNIPVISLDIIRECVKNRCDYRESISKISTNYSNVDFTSIKECDDVYKLTSNSEDKDKIVCRCNEFYNWLLDITLNDKVKTLVVITHGVFLEEFLSIYSTKLGIINNLWFNNGEYRIGNINIK